MPRTGTLLTPSLSLEVDLRFALQFSEWAGAACEELHRQGFWANYTDPASGYPVFGERGGLTLNDVEVSLSLLKYPTVDLGVCKMISHPRYKTASYPATLAADAPLDILAVALRNALDGEGGQSAAAPAEDELPGL